jgi:hypothetical protein
VSTEYARTTSDVATIRQQGSGHKKLAGVLDNKAAASVLGLLERISETGWRSAVNSNLRLPSLLWRGTPAVPGHDERDLPKLPAEKNHTFSTGPDGLRSP